VLVFLLMRQVMPIASALAGGVALSSFGAVSRLVNWGMRRGAGAARGGVALAAGLAYAPAASSPRLTVERATWRVQ
jgi:drug/metabolite transporter superfamily protein YnfA